MTTSKNNTMSNYSETEISILKGCALMQSNGEPFFIVYVDDELKAYEGNKESFEAEWQEANEEAEQGADEVSFNEWCSENCTEVTPIEDEESGNYMVLTEEEADDKAAQYIKDSLWAFNASFIIEHSKLPYEAEEMVSSFTADKCESANDTIEALIDNMDEFIKDAISADGRGHFINSYDGGEDEQEVEGETFFVYRIN